MPSDGFAATKLSCMRGMDDSKNRTGQGKLLSDVMVAMDANNAMQQIAAFAVAADVLKI